MANGLERNPVADLEPEVVKAPEPEAYTPDEAAKLMQTALDKIPELVPVLALSMFAGLRVSEAMKTDLGKLPKNSDEFRTVDGKTGVRMAPFTETCKAWLEAQPRRKGQAWQQLDRHYGYVMKQLFKLAGVRAIHNGLRHSFISYRTAETRDVGRVADECGNSTSVIQKHYRQLVTSEAAKTFFAIRPAKPAENVTPIQQGKATA